VACLVSANPFPFLPHDDSRTDHYQVYCLDGQGSAIQEDGFVKCLLLDDDQGWSRTYNLEVIFFCVRGIFRRKPIEAPWEAGAAPWLETPAPVEPSGLNYAFEVVHHGAQGRRRKMEDTFAHQQCISLNGTDNAMICGIFDGHAGDACSRYAQEQLPGILTSHLESGKTWREALWRSFVDMDANFCSEDIARKSHAGCTANVVLFDGVDRLFCGNLGDCRMIICSAKDGGTARDISFDCRADRPDEVARIVDAGGFMSNKRVNGQLAVSRAMGDVDYKTKHKLVSSEPEITETRIQVRLQMPRGWSLDALTLRTPASLQLFSSSFHFLG
jgi:serine/threonine protein phosphatase PrpC